jgi:uncharacterized protein YicC (UPF0701 family)
MSNTPIEISTDLAKILERMDSKLDNLQTNVNSKFDTLEKDINNKFSTLEKDVNNKIDTLQKDVNKKFDKLQEDITDLKVGQAKLEEKVAGLSQRIDNQEFVSRGVLIGLIVAIAGGAAKLFGFIGNP